MNARRLVRLLLALAASVLAHLWLLYGNQLDLDFARSPTRSTLIEARLTPPIDVVKPPPERIPTPIKPAARRPHAARPSNAVANEIEQPLPSLSEPVAEAPPQPENAVADAAETVAADPEPAAPPPATVIMPQRIDIEFSVTRSSGGSGIARQVWQRVGEDAYTITSTLEATGIASLFMHGKYVQISRGTIGADGLQPQLFTVERRNKIESAHFDRDAGRMTFDDGQVAAELSPEAQDLLSFTFQFAYNPPQRKSLNLLLTNGRKLGRYHYLVLDDEVLQTPIGAISTVHLHKLHEPDEDGMEMWLAPDLFYAPVKMLRVEKDGTRYELNMTSLNIES